MATRRISVNRTAPSQRSARIQRRPEHPFLLTTKPFALVPFMIAPVLPAETLENALLQSRVVTDPVKHPLIGWHKEYFWFYVKLRDLDARDAITAALVNPSLEMPGKAVAEAPKWYTANGAINWVQLCTQRIVEEFFRDENEAWNAWTVDGYPTVKNNIDNWADSLMVDANFEKRDIDMSTIDTVEELDEQMKYWQLLRDSQMTDMDYDDWLRAYGVRPDDSQSKEVKDLHRPELIRHVREWTYPTNTIDPSDGTPRSALSWAIAARSDKARFFKEPGFIVGLTTCRPKMYFANQKGSLAGFMDDAVSWLPPQHADNPWKSFIQFAEGAGPVPTITDENGYWVDLKDLFTRGDQFVNFALDPVNEGLVNLPKPNAQNKYVSETDIAELFVGTEADRQRIREDGVCQLTIRGRQRDTNPAVVATPPV